MKKRMPLWIALALASPGAAPCAEPVMRGPVVVGRLTQVTNNQVTVDDVHAFRFDPARAQCFDFRAQRMTCATLVGVGYADKARLTLVGDTVQRIDVLELQQ